MVIESLTAEQVDTYLATLGDQVYALRRAVQDNLILQELATTPLMLTTLVLAYQGVSLDGLVTSSSVDERQIFATYIQRMVTRRGVNTRYTLQQTTYWLSWLAQLMKKCNLTEIHPQDIYWMFCSVSPDYRHGGINGLLDTIVDWIDNIPLLQVDRESSNVGYLLAWLPSAFPCLFPLEVLVWLIWKSPAVLFIVFLTVLIGSLIINALIPQRYYHRLPHAPFIAFTKPDMPITDIVRWLILNLIYAFICGLAYTLVYGPTAGIATGIGCGIINCGLGLVSTKSFEMWYRFVEGYSLWRAKRMPINYMHFLDYASERILLRKLGGNYIFIHLLLRDYFASCDTSLHQERE